MQLKPGLLLDAYARGIFPMYHPEVGETHWYSPDPRAIIPLDGFQLSRRLARMVRSGRFAVTTDMAFEAVMRACAEPAPGRETTWINDEFVRAYSNLQRRGNAHSVESWLDGELVGGLYGVHVGGLFAGESMFSRVADASKVALVHLVGRLIRGGFVLLDTQFVTEHLLQFGTVEIPRSDYLRRVRMAVKTDGQWGGALTNEDAVTIVRQGAKQHDAT